MQHDLYALGAGDDMRVRDDVAVGIDDRARADAALPSDHEPGLAAARALVDGTIARDQHLHDAHGHARRELLNRRIQIAQETAEWGGRLVLCADAGGAINITVAHRLTNAPEQWNDMTAPFRLKEVRPDIRRKIRRN